MVNFVWQFSSQGSDKKQNTPRAKGLQYCDSLVRFLAQSLKHCGGGSHERQNVTLNNCESQQTTAVVC